MTDSLASGDTEEPDDEDGAIQPTPSSAPPQKPSRPRKRKKLGPGAAISWKEICSHFNLPLAGAAKELGVCDTVLKQQCRKLGLKKWPHRQFRQITNMIDCLEKQLETDTIHHVQINARLKELQHALAYLLEKGKLEFSITKRRRSITHFKNKTQPTNIDDELTKMDDDAVKKEAEAADTAAISCESPINLPETGFRTHRGLVDRHSNLGASLMSSSVAKDNADEVVASDLLSMDFSEVFDDEQEAKFCESLGTTS